VSLNAADLPKRFTLSELVAADGSCTISFRAQGRYAWQVEQISTEMQGAISGSECNLFVNGSMVTPLLPRRSVAAGDPPLPVYPGDVVTIVWSGCTPGAQGKALVIYRQAGYS
jgi:hypothetical protein